MTHDMETLEQWLHGCLIVAAICATSFPVLYSFFPWHSTLLGRLLMLQAIAFALAIDITLLFQYWYPSDIMIIFWLNAFVFTFIAASTFALTVMLWRTNRAVLREHSAEKRRKTDV